MLIPESTKLNWKMLNSPERKKFSLLIGFVFVFNFIDMAAIASFIPFIDILSSLDHAQKYSYLKTLHAWLNHPSHLNFCLIVGSLSLGLLVLKTACLVLLNLFKVRFSNEVYERKSTEMLDHYLSLPYGYFLTNNTSGMLKAVTKDINIIRSSLVVTTNLFVSTISLALVTGLLFTIEPYLFLFAALFGVVSIKGINALYKNKVYKEGVVSEQRFKEVFIKGKQGLDGVKDIILTGSKKHFVETFNESLHQYTLSNIRGNLYKQNPAAYLELMAYALFMFSVFYLIHDKSSFQQAVPTLGALAMASKSIIPSLNMVNSSLAELKFYLPVLEHLESIFTVKPRKEIGMPSQPVIYEREIELKDVSYKYPTSSKTVLSGISFSIKKGSRLGFVGKSGSGKSTLMDVILGLHQDFEGDVLVDGKPIVHGSIQSFRSLVSYVPQNIFLLDASVWENIAFGESGYDKERLDEALKAAQIYELIQRLPGKEKEVIGERGVRLSGGERQRLGIARALYRNTPVIILDESTSALDNQTEREFQASIDLLGREKTLIIIAHRLSTVEKCDNILFMEEGQIVDEGNFTHLKNHSIRFQKFLHETHVGSST